MIKKLFIYIISALLIFSVTGCEKTDQPKEQAEEEGVQSDVEEQVTVPQVFFPGFTEKVAYANWTDDPKIQELSLNRNELLNITHVPLPVFRFDSVDELMSFRDEFDGILTFDRGYNEVPSFDEIAAEYDDSFFETGSVLLVYVSASSSSFRYGIDRIEVNGADLCIHVVNRNNPEAYDSAMAGWFVMAEMEKSDLNDVSSIDTAAQSWETPEIITLPGMIEYGSFSYAKIREIIDNLPADNRSAIKTEGFVNTEKAEDFWPTDRAKAEVTGRDYDLSQTFYDADEDIWMVHFWNSKIMGGDATVYMDGDGITLLITYGD